ncbi:MAG TPA: GNAT family N-acetyltransferase [Candidatus Tumulicola sp.]
MKFVRLSKKQAQKVDAELVRWNAQAVPFTQEEPFHRLQYGVKEDGALIAGAGGTLYCWGILYVDVVWVAEPHRHRGLGERLMNHLEEKARKLGCTLVHLDTFDFQARGFYEKLGYTLFGTLDECPPGHKRFFFKKALSKQSTSDRESTEGGSIH